MKKLLIVVVSIGLVVYFKPSYFSGLTQYLGVNPGVDEGEVVLFTFDDCGTYCESGIALLQSKNIAFQLYNVGDSEEARKKWQSMGGGNPFPVVHIGSTSLHGFDRMKWLQALTEHHGAQVLNDRQREAIRSHYNSDGSDKVVMYATEWCPYCKSARNFFAENNIAYTEVDVEKSAQGLRYYEALEGSGYPLIYVGARRFAGFGGSIPREIKNAL